MKLGKFTVIPNEAIQILKYFSKFLKVSTVDHMYFIFKGLAYTLLLTVAALLCFCYLIIANRIVINNNLIII